MKFSRIAEKVSSEADKGSEGREIYADRWRSDESDVDYSEEELADKNDGRWKLAAETFDSDQMTTKETPICYWWAEKLKII